MIVSGNLQMNIGLNCDASQILFETQKLPKLDLKLPKLDLKLPKLDLKLPKLDLKLPKLDLKLPTLIKIG